MAPHDWLCRPIAHRGLHDPTRGIIENTPSAFAAAIAAGFAIELDIQPSADGMAMVFHDATLDRLTQGKGKVGQASSKDLMAIRFKDSPDRMQSLPAFLEQVSGQVPILIEIKSDWRRYGAFESRVAEILSAYGGPVAVMSFDPHTIAAYATAAPNMTRGLIAGPFRNPFYWGHLSAWKRFTMRHLLSAFIAKPHFVAYDVGALPSAAPWVWKNLFKRPLLAWTVRNEAQRRRAERYADAMIFEGLRP